MTSNLKISSINHSVAARQERRHLLKAFWLAVAVLFLVELYAVQTSSMASIFGAILIAFAALLPLYLWCSGKALGMPIFPVFALTYLWTYALPLVSEHSEILFYYPGNIYLASATIAGFLLIGTFIWFHFVNFPSTSPKSYRVLRSQGSDEFLLIILMAANLFNMSFLGGWFALEEGTFALIRGTILALNVLAVFVLSYRCGTRELSKAKSNIFFVLLAFCIITSAASLFLVGALSIVLLAAIAFIVGRRQVPWLPIIVVLICLWPLHYGKGEMRAKYWEGYQPHFVQPWEYPAWYAEWIGYSLDYLNATNSQKEEKQSFIERASLIHLLLRAQAITPNTLPYLSGATYVIIPDLLVPRVLNASKLRSHEGTHLLNIYYRLQTREDTFKTTIGWGLLNEAYANFGFSGCVGLAIILGTAYGQATRWSMNTPLLSSRSFFAVLMMSFAFQSELTAGVYITALFQSIVPLVVISFVFMKAYSDSNTEVMFLR